MKDERFFVCTGIPKSGTTYLQRSINLHPDVSCPAEQNFGFIMSFVEQLAPRFNELLETIDRRTGGQGAAAIDQAAMRRLTSAIIVTLSRSFAGGKAVHGLNDNFLFSMLPFFDEILEQPRFVVIFRNPVDVSVSTWRHNRRLAEEEPEMRQAHLDLLANPENDLDGYVRLTGQRFGPVAKSYLDYARDRSNFLTVLYERMVAEPAHELRRIFRFLGVDDSDAVIRRVVGSSSKEAMARSSTHPDFFGLDRAAAEADSVSPGVRAEVLRGNADALEMLGYDVSALIGPSPWWPDVDRRLGRRAGWCKHGEVPAAEPVIDGLEAERLAHRGDRRADVGSRPAVRARRRGWSGVASSRRMSARPTTSRSTHPCAESSARSRSATSSPSSSRG